MTTITGASAPVFLSVLAGKKGTDLFFSLLRAFPWAPAPSARYEHSSLLLDSTNEFARSGELVALKALADQFEILLVHRQRSQFPVDLLAAGQ